MRMLACLSSVPERSEEARRTPPTVCAHTWASPSLQRTRGGRRSRRLARKLDATNPKTSSFREIGRAQLSHQSLQWNFCVGLPGAYCRTVVLFLCHVAEDYQASQSG